MTEQVKAALRAALWQAIATIGEKEAQRIVNEVFKKIDDDHYNAHRR